MREGGRGKKKSATVTSMLVPALRSCLQHHSTRPYHSTGLAYSCLHSTTVQLKVVAFLCPTDLLLEEASRPTLALSLVQGHVEEVRLRTVLMLRGTACASPVWCRAKFRMIRLRCYSPPGASINKVFIPKKASWWTTCVSHERRYGESGAGATPTNPLTRHCLLEQQCVFRTSRTYLYTPYCTLLTPLTLPPPAPA